MHNKVFSTSKKNIFVIIDSDKKSGRMKGLLCVSTGAVEAIAATFFKKC